MTKCYRVLFESFDKNNPDEVLSRSTVLEGTIEKPTNCLNFSMGLKNKGTSNPVPLFCKKLFYDLFGHSLLNGTLLILIFSTVMVILVFVIESPSLVYES